MARLVRIPLFRHLMVLGIHVVVPRHRIGVSIVLFDEQRRVLLLYHVFHPYVPWGLPGGWLGRNEAPIDCARRELKEETGLSAELGPVVHLARATFPSHLVMAYKARVNHSPMNLSAEIIKAKWFPHDALPEPLLPFTREAIQAALASEDNRVG